MLVKLTPDLDPKTAKNTFQGIPEEELLRQQQELFAKARAAAAEQEMLQQQQLQMQLQQQLQQQQQLQHDPSLEPSAPWRIKGKKDSYKGKIKKN
jgi:hypothetical protein